MNTTVGALQSENSKGRKTLLKPCKRPAEQRLHWERNWFFNIA